MTLYLVTLNSLRIYEECCEMRRGCSDYARFDFDSRLFGEGAEYATGYYCYHEDRDWELEP